MGRGLAPSPARRPAVALLPAAEAVPTNPVWHSLRRAGVTATDIRAALGLDPWTSAFTLYWRKVNGWYAESNDVMRWGSRFERGVCEEFLERHPDRCGMVGTLYAHPDRSWQLATPDITVRWKCDCGLGDGPPLWVHLDGCALHRNTNGLSEPFEAKTTTTLTNGEWGPDGSDDFPVYYRAQLLQQMEVLGSEYGHLGVVDLVSREYREYTVRRDQRDIDIINACGEAFHRRVNDPQAKPPDIDGHVSTRGTLKQLHESVEDRSVELPPELAEAYRRHRKLEARLDSVGVRIENRIRDLMGSAKRATVDGEIVCYRSVYEATRIATKPMPATVRDYLRAKYGTTKVTDKLQAPRKKKGQS